MPTQTGLRHFLQLAEAQHHPTFRLLNDIESADPPKHQRGDEHCAEADTAGAQAANAASPTAASATAKQATQSCLNISYDLIEIGRTLMPAPARSPWILVPGVTVAGLIPRHGRLLCASQCNTKGAF